MGAVHMLNVWWESGLEPRRAEGLSRRCAARFGKPLRFGDDDHIGWLCGLRAGKRLFG